MFSSLWRRRILSSLVYAEGGVALVTLAGKVSY